MARTFTLRVVELINLAMDDCLVRKRSFLSYFFIVIFFGAMFPTCFTVIFENDDAFSHRTITASHISRLKILFHSLTFCQYSCSFPYSVFFLSPFPAIVSFWYFFCYGSLSVLLLFLLLFRCSSSFMISSQDFSSFLFLSIFSSSKYFILYFYLIFFFFPCFFFHPFLGFLFIFVFLLFHSFFFSFFDTLFLFFFWLFLTCFVTFVFGFFFPLIFYISCWLFAYFLFLFLSYILISSLFF